MSELNYAKIQSEVERPQWLCRHCGKCMPILKEGSHNNDYENCIRGPICVWDTIPEDCGYAGWMFKEREHQKHLVRKVKEEILALSCLPPDTIVAASKITAKEKIDTLKTQIKPWFEHGGEAW